MNKYGIEEDIWNEILKVFSSIEEIEKVILFGSRTKNTYKNTSDIDLAVEFTNPQKKLLLIRKLDEVRCVLKFDVLDINGIANEKLLDNIKKDGKVIYIKSK